MKLCSDITKPDIPDALMGQYMDYLRSLNQLVTNGNHSMPPSLSHDDYINKTMQLETALICTPTNTHDGTPSQRPNHEPMMASPSY